MVVISVVGTSSETASTNTTRKLLTSSSVDNLQYNDYCSTNDTYFGFTNDLLCSSTAFECVLNNLEYDEKSKQAADSRRIIKLYYKSELRFKTFYFLRDRKLSEIRRPWMYKSKSTYY